MLNIFLKKITKQLESIIEVLYQLINFDNSFMSSLLPCIYGILLKGIVKKLRLL